jgi:GR25 family glycosyltransferase involved in LPS biosynthesis
MKSFVITLNTEPSMRVAKRCVNSLPDFAVRAFAAITPADDPAGMMKERGISPENFHEKYSFPDSCMAAFMSHHTLWEMCVADNEEYQIFEHDAVCIGHLPAFIPYDKCINLGYPSYGKFKTPESLGVGPLISKNYFPGAHAYRVKPAGARELIERAKIDAGPTDIFIHSARFPWLQEYYPWPMKADDSFSTIQREEGCLAKHNWNGGENFEILR